MRAGHSDLSRRDFFKTTAACVVAAGAVGAGCMQQSKRNGKMLAICGLDCGVCPALIAYKTDDQALRVKTAAEWSNPRSAELKPEQINCVGCLKTEGVHFSQCSHCKIRKCGREHNVTSCALCSEYPCETISNFLANTPPAKANLEELRRAQ